MPCQQGEAILEVETDKVNLEVEASTDGILMGITAHPGDTVPIGQTIAYLVKPGESFSGAGPAPAGQVAVDTAQPAPSRSSPLMLRTPSRHRLSPSVWPIAWVSTWHL